MTRYILPYNTEAEALARSRHEAVSQGCDVSNPDNTQYWFPVIANSSGTRWACIIHDRRYLEANEDALLLTITYPDAEWWPLIEEPA